MGKCITTGEENRSSPLLYCRQKSRMKYIKETVCSASVAATTNQGEIMKRIFKNKELTYEMPGYRLQVNEKGVDYTTDKKTLAVKFADVGSIFLLRYCNSNHDYSVVFRDKAGRDIAEIRTDMRNVGYQYANFLETKSILIAFAESRLAEGFPDDLATLDIQLAFSLKEKEIRLKGGALVGAKHRVNLSDIRRVKCIGNGTLNSVLIYTKDKGGFFDSPAMKLPVNELLLPILEAAIVQNTGRGIDFSQGNGFDQKTSEYILTRYMNATFFQNEDGSVTDDWHKIAYDHIRFYQSDILIGEDGEAEIGGAGRS